tara:strand:- start:312 stop:854 length:543 start_codon:yes stop_codon:yes gene_type:complete
MTKKTEYPRKKIMDDEINKEILRSNSQGPYSTVWTKVKPKSGGLRFNRFKPKLSLIPSISRTLEAIGWMVGAAKYGEHNWEKGMDWSIPLNCMARHWEALNDGKWVDKETGVPHIALIMCNATMLAYYYYHNVGKNDLALRPPLARKIDFDPAKIEQLMLEYKDKRSTEPAPVMEPSKLL